MLEKNYCTIDYSLGDGISIASPQGDNFIKHTIKASLNINSATIVDSLISLIISDTQKLNLNNTSKTIRLEDITFEIDKELLPPEETKEKINIYFKKKAEAEFRTKC